MQNQSTHSSKSGLSVSEFGKTPDGKTVDAFQLSNSGGMQICLISYGATLAQCLVPDKHGNVKNVVLGFDNLDQYLKKHPRFGATIGRYANRIANAEFHLEGKLYKLTPTHGKNTLHGGLIGFDKKVWTGSAGSDDFSAWVDFSYLSPHMEEGFPGNLEIRVRYTLNDENVLSIDYLAKTDSPTVINLTNHSYFNLSGSGTSDVLGHTAQFFADRYTETDEFQIPTGKILPTENSCFDFSTPHSIGDRLAETGAGYDHNLVISRYDGNLQELGWVLDPQSGRKLTVYTDQPAFQFFTANGLDGSITGIGGTYKKYGGFCLETQHYPDSVHHPEFPNVILRPGEKFQSRTEFHFQC